MSVRLSPRLLAIVDALPLAPGLRVLEIGCGPGAAAREVARRVGPTGHVLAIDRSARAISQASAAPNLTFRQAAVETFQLEPGEPPYDLAFAARVGALDGRHSDLEPRALRAIAAALTPEGVLMVDGRLRTTDRGADGGR